MGGSTSTDRSGDYEDAAERVCRMRRRILCLERKIVAIRVSPPLVEIVLPTYKGRLNDEKKRERQHNTYDGINGRTRERSEEVPDLNHEGLSDVYKT